MSKVVLEYYRTQYSIIWTIRKLSIDASLHECMLKPVALREHSSRFYNLFLIILRSDIRYIYLTIN